MLEPAPFGFAGRDRQVRFAGRDQRARPLLRTILGDVLRRARLAQRRTLADVARAARVSMPYLSEVERGRKEASSEVLAAICEALRIDLPDVLAEVGRDLIEFGDRRARRERVVRLGAVPERADQLDDLPGDPSSGAVPGPGLPPHSGPAQARCLLAA
jgi:transcriptional regulator with XRE-family HTH domain